jgi:hypothetical protein
MSHTYAQKVSGFLGLIFALLTIYFLWTLAGQPGLINFEDGSWIFEPLRIKGCNPFDIYSW